MAFDKKISEERLSLSKKSNKVLFLHDKALPHTPKIVKDLIKDFGREVLSHPLYSPDIAPSNFHLFRSLSSALADKKFQNKEEVYNILRKFFDEKKRSFYSRGIKLLKEKWAKVIEHNGTILNKSDF